MRVRREHRIEDVSRSRPSSMTSVCRFSSVQPLVSKDGRPSARVSSRLVTQDGEGQVETIGGLALVARRLRAEREHAHSEVRELLVRVPEPAGLRSAAARPGNRVPAGRQLLVGPAGAGVAEEDSAAVELVETDGRSAGRVSARSVERLHRGDDRPCRRPRGPADRPGACGCRRRGPGR